jgi:hypothetical protein
MRRNSLKLLCKQARVHKQTQSFLQRVPVQTATFVITRTVNVADIGHPAPATHLFTAWWLVLYKTWQCDLVSVFESMCCMMQRGLSERCGSCHSLGGVWVFDQDEVRR